MSSTTDRYRRRHGDTAYGYLAAQASMASLEALAADLMRMAGAPTRPAAHPSTAAPLTPVVRYGRTTPPAATARTTPGAVAGRDLTGRALPVRAPHQPPASPGTAGRPISTTR